VRWPLLAAWAAGFALYQWLSPQGPSWWTDLVQHLSPGHARLTASLPSFALAFCLTLVANRVDSLRGGRSQSSGTSRSTALTAASRGRAGRRSTRPGRCACSGGRRSWRPRAPRPTAASCCRRSCGSACRCCGAAATRRRVLVPLLGQSALDGRRGPGPRLEPADLRRARARDWVHVGALARSDFPAETLAALARDRRLSFDGQGWCGPRGPGRSCSTPSTTPRCCSTSRC
jgi:hypothetical protein